MKTWNLLRCVLKHDFVFKGSMTPIVRVERLKSMHPPFSMDHWWRFCIVSSLSVGNVNGGMVIFHRLFSRENQAKENLYICFHPKEDFLVSTKIRFSCWNVLFMVGQMLPVRGMKLFRSSSWKTWVLNVVFLILPCLSTAMKNKIPMAFWFYMWMISWLLLTVTQRLKNVLENWLIGFRLGSGARSLNPPRALRIVVRKSSLNWLMVNMSFGWNKRDLLMDGWNQFL